MRDKLQAALRAESSGLGLAPEKLTVADRPSVRPRTYVSCAGIVRVHLDPSLGTIPLARLSPQRVQAFLNAKSASGLAPRTVGYIRAVLRRAPWGSITPIRDATAPVVCLWGSQ